MANVKIEQDGAYSTVSVDGVPMKHVTRIAVQIEPHSLPLVTLDLAAFQNALELSDARLKIGAIDAPEELERAILAHLSEKYAPKQFEVTSSSVAWDVGANDEMATAGPFVLADWVRYAFGRMHAHALNGNRREGDPEPAGFMCYEPTGTMIWGDAPQPMGPAAPAIQSVAAGLLKLPVREMAEPGRIMSESESAEHLERFMSSSSLTTVATDGERNGRMAWVPGARA